MDIDASQTRDVEQLLGKDLSKGGDDDQVRSKLADLFDGFGIPDARRLKNRDIPFLRANLHRSLDDFPASSLLPVRLCDRKDHLLTVPAQGVKS